MYNPDPPDAFAVHVAVSPISAVVGSTEQDAERGGGGPAFIVLVLVRVIVFTDESPDEIVVVGVHGPLVHILPEPRLFLLQVVVRL